MISAPVEPPGSRVSTTFWPTDLSLWARVAACVDFPLPSPPSKVIKCPRKADQPFPVTTRLQRRLPSYPLGSGTEQRDYHFSHSIESALRHVSFTDVFSSFQWHGQDQVVVAPDLEISDRRSFGHRRRHGPAVDDTGDQPLRPRFGQHYLDLSVGLQRDAAARAAKNLRGPDCLAFGKDRALLKIPETPFECFLCFVGAFLGCVDTRDGHDQPQVVLDRRPDQAITRLFCVTGLEAVGAVQGAQKWVAILLPDLVPGEVGLRKEWVEIRVGADDVPRKYCQLAGRHLLVRIRQAV